MTAQELRRRRERLAKQNRKRQKERITRSLVALGSMLALTLTLQYLIRTRLNTLPGEGVEVPEYVEEDLLPVNEWSRPGTALEEINGVVIHYVGNPGTSARANRNYFASLAGGGEDTYASSHFIVGLEGEVIQCIPLTEKAYASNQRNPDTVAIEVCHPDESGQFSPVTYQRVTELTAWLCLTFDLDPREDVIRHYDVTGKRCPLYYVDHPEAWDALREEVAARVSVAPKPARTETLFDVLFPGGSENS